MRTYPRLDERTGRVVGFEIDNVYIGLSALGRTLCSVDGVTDVRRRKPFSKWEEIHLWFRYKGTECVVWEPYGDSSRYWIGQSNSPEPVDIAAIEEAFKHYKPPLHRQALGDISTLHFLKKLLGRDDEWRPVNPPPP